MAPGDRQTHAHTETNQKYSQGPWHFPLCNRYGEIMMLSDSIQLRTGSNVLAEQWLPVICIILLLHMSGGLNGRIKSKLTILDERWYDQRGLQRAPGSLASPDGNPGVKSSPTGPQINAAASSISRSHRPFLPSKYS